MESTAEAGVGLLDDWVNSRNAGGIGSPFFSRNI
jgi:hypothetical protein